MPDRPDAYVGKTIASIPLARLTPHPDNETYFGPANPVEANALRDDIARQGLRTPLIVCGRRCASPRYRILGGHQRADALRALGMAEAPVIEVDDLTADDELDILLGDNVAVARARKLTPRQLYNIEEAHWQLLGRRAGQRSDLAGVQKGETNKIVAEKTGGNANAVNNRQKVFGSPLSPAKLQDDVEHQRISQTRAAAIVRKIEKSAAERLFADMTSSPEAETRLPRSPSLKKPKGRDSASAQDIRRRIESAAVAGRQSRGELVDAITDLLGRFPSGPPSPAALGDWNTEMQETWLPLIAELGDLVRTQGDAASVVRRAVAALEASTGRRARP